VATSAYTSSAFATVFTGTSNRLQIDLVSGQSATWASM
jgi:hypothetical protein